jgi:hypothetical protein
MQVILTTSVWREARIERKLPPNLQQFLLFLADITARNFILAPIPTISGILLFTLNMLKGALLLSRNSNGTAGYSKRNSKDQQAEQHGRNIHKQTMRKSPPRRRKRIRGMAEDGRWGRLIESRQMIDSYQGAVIPTHEDCQSRSLARSGGESDVVHRRTVAKYVVTRFLR